MAEYYKIECDKEDNFLFFDKESGLPISDKQDPLSFTLPIFDDRFCKLRMLNTSTELTTDDAITGISGGGFWGDIRFQGKEDIARERVELEMRKDVWRDFQRWFDAGGNVMDFVWPRGKDSVPVKAFFDRGSLNSVNVVSDGTASWYKIKFNLVIQNIETEEVGV